MKRREFITLLGASACNWPLLAVAQQGTRILRIGVLWHAGNEEEEAVYLAALRQGLREFGYVEGRNIVLENRFPNEIPERFASLAAELAALKVDVLVAVTRLAALAAQRATTTIPVVFVAVPNPVGSKLVASLARPGGNVTGLSNMALDLTAKRLEFLKLALPGLERIALLVNGNDKDGARQYTEECQAAADRLKVTLRPVEIRTPSDLVPAFSQMVVDRVDGVVVTQDGMFFAARQQIADTALARQLPTIVYSRETIEAGALASYGPSNVSIFRRTGYYVDKILKGAPPATLPVEQPTRFEFIINLKAAKKLGIEITSSVLARADEVIE
jgi:ABC-type uncharacterized transport system substrate-binding protein